MATRQPYLFTVSRGQLCPFDAHAEAHLAKFHDGTVLKCANLVQPRSLPFQGLYWATLANIVENTEIAPTANHLHDALVKLSGFVSVITDIHGNPVEMVRDSTAFDKMDEAEFHEYVEKAIKVLAGRFGIVWDDYTKHQSDAAQSRDGTDAPHESLTAGAESDGDFPSPTQSSSLSPIQGAE